MSDRDGPKPGEATRPSAEEVLRAVLEDLPIRIWENDPSGICHYHDGAFPIEGSVPVGSLVGVNVFDAYAGHAEGLVAIRTALAGGVAKHRSKDNQQLYDVRVRPRRNAEGEVVGALGIAVSVLDLVEMQRELLSSQRLLRSVVDHAPVILWAMDASGRITLSEGKGLAAVGARPGELVGANAYELYEDRPDILEANRRCLAGEEISWIVEIGDHTLDAHLSPLRNERGEVVGVIGVCTDVTERHRAEHQLAASQERLRVVVAKAPVVVWSVDREGIFTLSEGAGLAALGLAPGQVVGKSVYDVYEEAPEVLGYVERGLAGDASPWTVLLNGAYFETQPLVLRDERGDIDGLLGVSMDVTAKVHADAERMRLHDQLLQVQKLESLGVLAGGIAHDFNNLLTAILGSASTAKLSIPKENPAHDDLGNVIAAARRAATLTRQLLAYSGKGQFEVRSIDLSAHVRELASLLETTISKKVQLRLELAPGLPTIEADVAQIQQIVMNLVINGAEAMGEESGTVLVTTGTQAIDDEYSKSLFPGDPVAPGAYVFLEVHDTGCGMDEATKARIFDPFFTTKFTGRGLGLAAVLGIVRSHKGAIRVYSAPGKGTTFKVFFPASRGAASITPKPVPAFRGDGVALVVDDDAAVRTTTRRMLELFGFTVIEAVDGQDGVEVFAKHAAEIKIVVLDMTMPRLNGEEAFREIRHVRDDVRVILMSGYNEIEATRRFTSKGLAGFLQKPFSPADLAQKLSLALTS